MTSERGLDGLVADRERAFFNPREMALQAYDRVYRQGQIVVGWPEGVRRLHAETIRKNSAAVIGITWGDEGKGRMIDDTTNEMLRIPGIKTVVVDRFQGGSNAGHTVVVEGEKIALHHVPSGILHPEVVNVMDQGMVIHMGDLQTEIEDIESHVGDIRGKLFLSQDAGLVTDLERAEEVLNRVITSGKSKGGTGQGISPAYANQLNRKGKIIEDLFKDDWREVFGQHYDQYKAMFDGYTNWLRESGIEIIVNLADFEVPDLRRTREYNADKPFDKRKQITRKVGTKEEYLDALEAQREWFVQRDKSMPEGKKMITNTYIIHRNTYRDESVGVIIEGSQAQGLHSKLGRLPDVTSSDTSVYGILSGTGFWKPENIEESMGVIKATYASSVGASKMVTNVDLLAEGKELSADQFHAMWIQKFAREYGTTTGRPRDICWVDLNVITYNCRMSGIQTLAVTHLDVAKKDTPIKICTHYTDANGKIVPYQPGLKYQKNLTPHYIELPGFDGEEVMKAKSFEELPIEAQQLLSFLQLATGYPIIMATTGPQRDSLIHLHDIN